MILFWRAGRARTIGFRPGGMMGAYRARVEGRKGSIMSPDLPDPLIIVHSWDLKTPAFQAATSSTSERATHSVEARVRGRSRHQTVSWMVVRGCRFRVPSAGWAD